MAKWKSIVEQWPDAWAVSTKIANFSKKCVLSVDGAVSLITLPARLKRDSRVARQRSWFWPEFGTANWNSILSRHDESRTRGMNYRRRKIEFFCGRESRLKPLVL
jgi:hypothetical protein